MGGEPKAKKRRLTKNERRRLKKKLAKSKAVEAKPSVVPAAPSSSPPQDVQVIYVAANPLEQNAPEAAHFKDVLKSLRSGRKPWLARKKGLKMLKRKRTRRRRWMICCGKLKPE